MRELDSEMVYKEEMCLCWRRFGVLASLYALLV